jgi:hypothetical protein
MVAKDQAILIGTALVEQAKAAQLARRNAAARRVPFTYRFPELDQFEAWERPLIVAEARRSVRKERSFIAAWMVSVFAAIGLVYVLIAAPRTAPVLFIWLIAAAALAPMYFFQRRLMREYIRRKHRASLYQSESL